MCWHYIQQSCNFSNQFLDVPSLLVVKGLGTKPPSSAISMYLLRLQSRLRMRILVFRAFFQKKRTRRLSVCAHRQMFFFVEMGKRLNNVGKRNLCEKRNFVREKKRIYLQIWSHLPSNNFAHFLSSRQSC